MIVTIDGPAGAGKSSTARALAQRLGFRFLDTGAMYRTVALAAVRRNVPWDRPEKLAELARMVEIDVTQDRVLLDGEDVTSDIRTAAITAVTHYAANNPGVRAHLVEVQKKAAGNDNLVTEGRDQGTIVFPQAECKIYLTASAEERARRRLRDLQARGESHSLERVLTAQNERDLGDTQRTIGPLAAAEDAIELVTDGLTREQVVDALERLVRARMLARPSE
jgi:CMP/dCMP kinase